MGCLAAQVISKLKEGVGNIYIEPPGTRNCDEHYHYELTNKNAKIHLNLFTGYGDEWKSIYEGLLDNFDPDMKYEED